MAIECTSTVRERAIRFVARDACREFRVATAECNCSKVIGMRVLFWLICCHRYRFRLFTNLALRTPNGLAPPRFSAKRAFRRLNLLTKSDLSDCSDRVVQMSKNKWRVVARCVTSTLTFCTLTMNVVAIEPAFWRLRFTPQRATAAADRILARCL
jgi:hypothetical protein